MKTTLHHFAYNVAPGSLEFVLELFKELGCSLSYRKNESRWCMIKQQKSSTSIQIIETKEKPKPTEIKKNTHIAFITDNAEKDIHTIENWLKGKNIRMIKGAWSKNEFWFDLPDIFVNFVIEIMSKSILK